MPQIKNSIETRLPQNPEYVGKVYVQGRYYTADEVLAFTAHLVSLEAQARLAKERAETEAKRDYLPVGTLIRVFEDHSGRPFLALKTAEYGWVKHSNHNTARLDCNSALSGQDDSHWVTNGTILYQPKQ